MEKKCQALKLGDLIGVDHGYYQHFGIYIGDYEVIHYDLRKQKQGKMTVAITRYELFLDNEEECFVCDFTRLIHPPDKVYEHKVQSKSLFKLIEPKLNLTEDCPKESCIFTAFQSGRYKVYSPQETVRRAYERLGEVSCNWIIENCEHFPFWCKTGIEESYQVNALIKELKQNWVLAVVK